MGEGYEDPKSLLVGMPSNGKGLEAVVRNTRQMYSREDVLEKTTQYFNGDDLAATNWMNKYADKEVPANGDPEEAESFYELTPKDMHRRMAKEFARIEQGYGPATEEQRVKLSDYGKKRVPLTEEKIFGLFDKFRYIVPQGSVMASLGVPGNLSSLSNCVVVPPIFDSYGGIMETDQQLAQLFKRRCGVGGDISTLRPSNSHVSNSAKTTSGSVSFMHRFSNTTREVAQNGRRGALMLTMDVTHPDVGDFAVVKKDRRNVTGANISVKLTDKFMEAVDKGEEFTQQWPIDSKDPKVKKKIVARDLWNTIIDAAHDCAEPGLIFWDRQHNYSTSSVYPGHENISTNPCAEIAMDPDSCRLIAQNLYSFVENPFTLDAKFNYEKFAESTYETQRLMDGLVDLELEHIDRIREKINSDSEPDYIKEAELRIWNILYENGKNSRRTGSGFTGMGDAIAALGLKYDSDEAMREVEKIMKTKCESEFNSSIDMAIERGAFVDFDPKYEGKSEFVQMLKEEMPSVYERMMENGRRNISISTVAPGGSLSSLTQTTSGIEPVFEREYKRRRKANKDDPNAEIVKIDESGDAWEEFDVRHHGVEWWMKATGKSDIGESPYAGAASAEIDWIKRVNMQAIVQKYTTHSISSTINLPKDVEKEKVGEIYLEAWRQGLKGITVYRDTARDGILIKDDLENKVELIHNDVKKHPILEEKSNMVKYKVRRPENGDSLHIVLDSDLYIDDKNGRAFFIPDEDFQIRAPLGAPTSVSFAQSGMDRTEILRGPDPDYAEIISRLQSASSSEEEGLGLKRIKSVEHAVGVAMEHYLTRNGVVGRDEDTNKLVNNVRKVDLRKVDPNSDEHKRITKELARSRGEEMSISGNNGISKKDCPRCGADLVHEEGCVKCVSCGGYNKCG